MEIRTLQLEGIQRSIPDNIVKDGACQEIINARFEDGAWRPIGSKKKKFNFGNSASNIYFQQIAPDHYAYIYQTGNYVRARKYYQGQYEADQVIKDYGAAKTLKFISQGTVLIINNITDNKLETAWYDINTKNYTYIGPLLPELPRIEVESEDTEEYGQWPFNVYNKDELYAFYLTKDVEMMKDGYFTGYTIISYGFELFDGSIVHHSTPIVLEHAMAECYEYVLGGELAGQIRIKKYKNKITVKEGSTLCDIIKNDYKNIIRGIRFFMIRPWQEYSDIDTPMSETWKELKQDPNFSYISLIESRPDYYNCGFLSSDKLSTDYSTYICLGNLNDVALERSMGVNPGDFHKIKSSTLYNYNDRIFYGLINTELYKGFNPLFFIKKDPIGGSEGTDYEVSIDVEIKTPEGKKTVSSDWVTINYWVLSGTERGFTLARYVTYPDSRATQFRVMVKVGSTYYKAYDESLTPHPTLNFSYYKSDYPNETRQSLWVESGLFQVVNQLLDSNRVQSTKNNNPYVLPAINSYRMGTGKIIGFGANVVPVSEGQFGQYPLITFCSDGVWAMNISGDPEILIESITPLNNKICNNGDSILSALNNIIFTTKEGLFALAGRNAGEIAEIMEGSIESPLDDCLDYSSWITDPNHYVLTDLISSVPFETYIATAKMAFDTEHQELIISNPTYEYSYLYSLRYNVWYKVGEVFDSFVLDYPGISGYKMGVTGNFYGLYDLTEEENTYQPLHILTRPIKLQAGFKRIESAFLRGYTHTKAGFGFGFLLFGSLDNREYHLLNGRKPLEDMYDIELRHTPMTCRYFIIVAGGQCDEDTFITHFDLDLEAKFQNKLR